MTILYALIARQKNVLAEFTSTSGNFPTVTRVLLSKIPESDVDDGITFLCMSEEDAKRRIAFAFLEDVMSLWREKFRSIEQTALAFSLNDAFSPVLKQRIDYYSTNQSTTDNITRVQAQIESVKDVMVENIEKVLERGEKIELLVDKTDKLNQQAYKFERSSRTLKRDMLCKKYRNYCVVVVVIIILIFFVTIMVCRLNFQNCKRK